MNDTLKAAGRIGAELGAAKAENERLREALQWIADYAFGDNGNEAAQRARAALSQQAEPKCATCNDVGIVGHSMLCPECSDPAEPAPAQDEREVARTAPDRIYLVIGEECPADASFHELADVTWCEDDIDGNGIEYLRRV